MVAQLSVTETTPRLRSSCGRTIPRHGWRWLDDPGPEEHEVLDRAIGPVLDVGCGPARHVLTLAARGVPTLGIDNAPSAIELARRRAAQVLLRSVFDRLPGEGRWGTALLLDGNIGIGGDPESLLSCVRALVCVELADNPSFLPHPAWIALLGIVAAVWAVAGAVILRARSR